MVGNGQADYMDADADTWIDCGRGSVMPEREDEMGYLEFENTDSGVQRSGKSE